MLEPRNVFSQLFLHLVSNTADLLNTRRAEVTLFLNLVKSVSRAGLLMA